MTVPNEFTPDTYEGSDSTPDYDYTFPIQEASELRVIVREDEAGEDEILTLDVDYTVDEDTIGDEDGGSITFIDDGQAWLDGSGNLATGYTLTIDRDLPVTQEKTFRNQKKFHGSRLEDALDRVIRNVQDLKRQLASALKLPESEIGSEILTRLPGLSARAGRILSFDEDGNLTTVLEVPEGSLSVSAFGEALLDDPDADTALSTLGLSDYFKTLVAAANAGSLQSLLGLSAFVKTLLDDADAAAFLATLGLTVTAFAKTVLDDGTADAALVTLGAGIPNVAAAADVATGDSLLIYDASAGAAKKATVQEVAGGILSALVTVTPKTAPYPIVAADNGKVFTNEGAAGSIAFTLPAAAAGYKVTFVVQAAFALVITAGAGDTIRIGGAVSAAAGTATSADVGSSITLVAINATEWVSLGREGNWAIA